MQDIEILKSSLCGANLRKLMRSKKTNKWRIHRDCHIAYQTLCNWQSGRTRPSERLAIRAGAYLGLIPPTEAELVKLKEQAAELQEKIERLTRD